jgi:drug/metabolite transporter (DMT)-like permease
MMTGIGLAWGPLAMVIVGSLLYHIAQKSIPGQAPPLLVIGLAYLVGLFFCLAGLIVYGNGLPKGGLAPILVRPGIWMAAIGIGVSAFLIEIGYLLTYRTGWDLSLASVLANMAIALLLLIVGGLFFGERITGRTIVGVLCCLIGFLLLSRRR